METAQKFAVKVNYTDKSGGSLVKFRGTHYNEEYKDHVFYENIRVWITCFMKTRLPMSTLVG